MPLKLAVFVAPYRAVQPGSGVGRHINGVLRALASREDVDLHLYYGRDQVEAHRALDPDLSIVSIPGTALPWSQRTLEWRWKLGLGPKLDRWLHADTDAVLALIEQPVALSRRFPLLVTVHDLRFFEPSLTPLQRERRGDHVRAFRWRQSVIRAARRADGLLAMTHAMAADIARHLNYPRDRIHLTGNGLTVSPADHATPVPTVPSPHALLIGGGSRIKGTDRLIKLAWHLDRIDSPWRLVLHAPHLETGLEKALRAHPRIELREGWRHDAELHGWLAGADVYLTLSRYEGFGITPLEAMALGVPVVASSTPAHREVCAGHALLVDGDDEEAVAAALERARTHPPDREAARAHAFSFTWDRVAANVVTAIHHTRNHPRP